MMKNSVRIVIGVTACLAIVSVADAETESGYEYAIKTSGVGEKLNKYLPKFAEYGFVLYLFVGRGNIGSADFRDTLVCAKELGLRVKICPGLEREFGGPFPNEKNVKAFDVLVQELLDYTESINDVVKGVAFNIEAGPPTDLQFQDAVARKDFKGLVQLAKDNMDRKQYIAATEQYNTLAQKVRDRGYEVQITTYALLLDDVIDGDTDMQDVLNMPMEGIPWDTRSFCVYSTEYAYLGGFPVSPYFVYSYAKTARRKYGENTWIAVGLIRNNERGYHSPDQLAADIAAAKAAGIKKIDLFCFSGMTGYPEYSFDDWAKTINTPPKKPKPNLKILAVRFGLLFADFLLNFIE